MMRLYQNPANILRYGIRFGAGFLEIFEDDIHNEGFRDLIAAGSVLLGGKCNCGNF